MIWRLIAWRNICLWTRLASCLFSVGIDAKFSRLHWHFSAFWFRSSCRLLYWLAGPTSIRVNAEIIPFVCPSPSLVFAFLFRSILPATKAAWCAIFSSVKLHFHDFLSLAQLGLTYTWLQPFPVWWDSINSETLLPFGTFSYCNQLSLVSTIIEQHSLLLLFNVHAFSLGHIELTETRGKGKSVCSHTDR